MKKRIYIFVVLLFCGFFCAPACGTQEDPFPSGKSAEPTRQAETALPIAATEEPCETTAPQEGLILAGYKICIDPGHQAAGNSQQEPCAPWNDKLKAKCTSGACGNYTGTEEYILNLAISGKLREKLEALGADVYLTRDVHTVNISNKERAEAANRFGADMTLRIHCNSAESETVEGIELYVRGAGDGTPAYHRRSEADYREATALLASLCTATGAVSRGVFRSDAYTGINWCEGPCIIVECGFLSNEKEDRLLNTAAYQDRIVAGITNYFVSSRDSSGLVSSDK